MLFQIEDANLDDSDYQSGSLSIRERFEDESEATFEIFEDSVSDIKLGHDVKIYDENDDLLFRGQVHEYTHEQPRPNDSQNFYEVTATDFHEIVARRVVSGVYDDVPAGDIVKDLINRFLSDEGITQGTIDDGVTLYDEKIQFQHADRALRRLARKSFVRWWVDTEKKLHFTQPETVNAPFPIDDTLRNIRLYRSREDYRNRQYVASEAGEGTEVTYQHQIPSEYTDNRSIYRTELPFEPSKISEVRVYRDGDTSGEPEIFDCEVGSRHLYYTGPAKWSPDVPAFSVFDRMLSEQTTARTPAKLDTNDIIQIDYVPKGRSMVVSESEPSQEKRKNIEKSGTGIYADILHDHAAHSYQACKSLARGLVKKFNAMPVQISYTSYDSGLDVGQVQEIDLPDFQTDANVVTIEEITIEDVERDDGKLRRKVETEYGNISSWKNYLAEMAENPQPDNPQAEGRTQLSAPDTAGSINEHFGTEDSSVQKNKTQTDNELDVAYQPAGYSEDSFYAYNNTDEATVYIIPLGEETEISSFSHGHGSDGILTAKNNKLYIKAASNDYTSVYDVSDPSSPALYDNIPTEKLEDSLYEKNQGYTTIGSDFVFVEAYPGPDTYVRTEGDNTYTKYEGGEGGGRGNKNGELIQIRDGSYYSYIEVIEYDGNVQSSDRFTTDPGDGAHFEFASVSGFDRPVVYTTANNYVEIFRYDPYTHNSFLYGESEVLYQLENTLNPPGTPKGMAIF